MAQKKITDLQLRSDVSDGLNFPSDDGIQSYRVTAVQVKSYILAAGNVGTTALANNAVDSTKLKSSASVDTDRPVATDHLRDASVTLAKLSPALQAQFIPVGTVLSTASAAPPAGFLLCDGSAVSRTTYAGLFGVLGISHGSGDGVTTFRIPDYRGRFLRMVDGSAGNDPDAATRTAMNTGGNAGNLVGSVQADQIASHRHFAFANEGGSHPGGGAGVSLNTTQQVRATAHTNSYDEDYNLIPTATEATVGRSGPTGGNETRSKNAYVVFILKY